MQRAVRIPNSSLASQAVGPPVSTDEMSFVDRTFPDVGQKLTSQKQFFSQLGKKMLGLTPLGLQMIDPQDSLLGTLSRQRQGLPGLSIANYAAMIKGVFQPKYWSSGDLVDNKYTQMEANFSLFWGLAIQIYEFTLVSDRTAFDLFMQGQNTLTQDR